jgi:hypothetical protein
MSSAKKNDLLQLLLWLALLLGLEEYTPLLNNYTAGAGCSKVG